MRQYLQIMVVSLLSGVSVFFISSTYLFADSSWNLSSVQAPLPNSKSDTIPKSQEANALHWSSKTSQKDIPFKHIFTDFSFYQPEPIKPMATGRATTLSSLDVERFPNLQGSRDLDVIRTHVKLMAFSDNNFYVYCLFGNTGDGAVIVNGWAIGYFESLQFTINGIPLSRSKNAFKAYKGIGPNQRDNFSLPSHTIYQSRKSNFSAWRYGPAMPFPEISNAYVASLITSSPQSYRGMSFVDDLLDFDWIGIRGTQVDVVVRQYLFNVPLKNQNSTKVQRFFIESEPFQVNVEALKIYKMNVMALRDRLFKENKNH